MAKKSTSNFMEKWFDVESKKPNSSKDQILKKKSPKKPKESISSPKKLKKIVKKQIKQKNETKNEKNETKKVKTKKFLKRRDKKISKPKIETKPVKSKIVVKEESERKWFPGFQRKPPPNAGMVEVPQGDKNCLQGLKFVITGVLNTLERENAIDIINKYGGRVTTGISGVTSYLIKGEEAGESKLRKAAEKGTKIIDENGLFDLIRKKSPNSAKKINKTIKNDQKLKISSKLNKKSPKINKKSPKITKKSKNLIEIKNSQFKKSAGLAEKYRPEKLSDLVGNNAAAKKVFDFVKNFRWAYQNKKRGLLLSGSPGIGKTSCVYAIARSLGIELIELNASDVRSRKILDSTMKGALTNQNVSRFFQKNQVGNFEKGKIILMEEVDGMSAGDYGGLNELVKFIAISKYPIICTCNDRFSAKIRTLASHCIDVQFIKPNVAEIIERTKKICELEKINLTIAEIATIVHRADRDIRNVFQTIEFLRISPETIQNQEKANISREKNKDSAINAWDASAELFKPFDKNMKNLGQRIGYYFADQMLVPLLVQENYLRHKLVRADSISVYCQAAKNLADSDLIGTSIYSSQNFGLMPFHSLLSCVLPAEKVSRGYKPFRLMFPLWLGKNSSRTKRKRQSQILHSKSALKIKGASQGEFGPIFHHFFYQKIVSPLNQFGKGGIDKAIKNAETFNFDKEDFDALTDFNAFETNSQKLDSKVKSLFSRRLNAKNKDKTELKAIKNNSKKGAKKGKNNAKNSQKRTKLPKKNAKKRKTEIKSDFEDSEINSFIVSEENSFGGSDESYSLPNKGKRKRKSKK